MIGPLASALAAVILFVLHCLFLAPVLIRHGSSAAFDMAIGIGIFLFMVFFYSTIVAVCNRPPRKK